MHLKLELILTFIINLQNYANKTYSHNSKSKFSASWDLISLKFEISISVDS